METKIKRENNIIPMISITVLFFMWGFITSLNDILIPYLKGIYSLSHFEANIVQFAFFIAYFLGSAVFYLFSKKGKDPITLWGYKTTIVIGLCIASLACFLFAGAAYFKLGFAFFLASLFILGLGLTFLQIAANPFVAIIGSPDTASSRLNLSQAFNSLGTTLGPTLGGFFIFSFFLDNSSQGPSAVIIPYLVLAALLAVLAVFIHNSKIRNETEQTSEKHKRESIFKKPYVVLGALGIFFYVGAEVTIGSNMVSYLKETFSVSEQTATAFLSYYWGGAMIGRFLGAVSLSRMKTLKKALYMLVLAVAGFIFIFTVNYYLHALSFAQVSLFLLFMLVNYFCFHLGKGKSSRSLAIFAFVNVVLLFTGIFSQGALAVWALLSIGLFNSIMWSNVFTLAIDRLGERTAEASSILIMMILGGAILPPVQGMAADCMGIRYSFLVPVVSYLYLFFYGIKGYAMGLDKE